MLLKNIELVPKRKNETLQTHLQGRELTEPVVMDPGAKQLPFSWDQTRNQPLDAPKIIENKHEATANLSDLKLINTDGCYSGCFI